MGATEPRHVLQTRLVTRLPARVRRPLGTFDLDEYVVDALRAGASGFLLKDASAAQLTEAVRTVARGEALLAPSLTRRLIETYLEVRTEPRTEAPSIEQLTPREKEVLVL